jgi:hypothetical protein
LVFDANGNLYEADFASGHIYAFTLGGVESTFASGLNLPDSSHPLIAEPLALTPHGALVFGESIA